MKRFLLLIAFLIHLNVNAQIMWHINLDTVITYYYQDGDEFSEQSLNKEKWGSWYGWARSIASNKEQQYYSDYENHELKNGCLNLTVVKKDIQAKLVDWMSETDSIKSGKGVFQGYNKREFKYSAGLIQSKKKYLKGYFEIKFKAPSGKGLWPAFWLYGGTPNEEIDIMELKSEREDQTHVDTHCQGCDVVYNFIGQKKSFGGWIKLNGHLNKEFNVISALWDDNEITYFLNGKSIAVSKVKFTQPKHIVANVAVPDNTGPFHPGPSANANSFEPFVIDYIRVWTKQQDLANSHQLNVTSDINSAPTTIGAKQHTKLLYGKKKEHTNEGIFVSLFEVEGGGFKLFCNGLKKKENYTLKLMLGDEVIYEKTTNETELNIPYRIKPGLKIVVTYKGKTAEKMYLLR